MKNGTELQVLRYNAKKGNHEIRNFVFNGDCFDDLVKLSNKKRSFSVEEINLFDVETCQTLKTTTKGDIK